MTIAGVDMADAAVRYAQMGWPVFPLHTPEFDDLPWGGSNEVRCSCGNAECKPVGKHPRLADGFKGATTDEDQIRQWWKTWPDANIGIATGLRSGLLVVDVDEIDQATDPWIRNLLEEQPRSVRVSTSRGRKQLFFHYGGEPVIRSGANVLFQGGDIRCEGGYVVAAPSLHRTRVRYRWDSDPADWDLDEPPEEAIEILRSREPVRAPRVDPLPETEAGEFELALVGQALEHVDPDDHDTWLRVGMALRATGLEGEAWKVFDAWSERTEAGNYDPHNNLKRWNTFKTSPNGRTSVTIGTVLHIAEENGWRPVPPELPHGFLDEIDAAGRVEVPEPIEEPKPEPTDDQCFPEHLLEGCGLVSDIVKWILDNSVMRQPALAMGATITAVGGLYGRCYRAGYMDTRPNIFALGIAGTGTGKSEAIKAIQKLWMAAEQDWMLIDRFASRQAFFTQLYRQDGVGIWMADEFGQMLASMGDRQSSGVVREQKAAILDFYSKASTRVKRDARAEYESLEDESKEPKATILIEPHLGMFGSATPNQFFSVIDGAAFEDGFLPRFLCFAAPARLPELRTDVAAYDPPQSLVDAVRDARTRAKANLVLDLDRGAGAPSGAFTVPLEPPAMGRLQKAAQRIHKGREATFLKDEATDSLATRVVENALRLALVRACARCYSGQPRIQEDDMAWGLEVAEWSMGVFARTQREYRKTGHERLMAQILDVVEAKAGVHAPEGWTSESAIYRCISNQEDPRAIEKACRHLATLEKLVIAKRHDVIRTLDPEARVTGPNKNVYRLVEK